MKQGLVLAEHPAPPRKGSIAQGQAASLPGARLWYTDTEGADEAIILLHPNTGTSEIWEKQVPDFVRQGFRVIVFDRRGWGRSLAEPGTGEQPGTAAADLDALADHLSLRRFHLLGVAGGGFVALDYASWRPERLLSLVVAASYGQFTEPEIQAFFTRLNTLDFQHVPSVLREVGATYRGTDPAGTARWIEIEHAARQSGSVPQPLRSPNTYAKIAAIFVPGLCSRGRGGPIRPAGAHAPLGGSLGQSSLGCAVGSRPCDQLGAGGSLQ
jgi:pimeloyl-ACP methyl ester carboxylesterase